MKTTIGVGGALLSLVAAIAYARAARSAYAMPRLASWTIWTLQSILDLVLTVAGGQRTGAPLLAAYVVANIIGLRAAIRSGGVGRLRPLDVTCGCAGLVGIAVWAGFDSPNVTVGIQIAGSAAAALPTVANAIAGHEPVLPWLLWTIGADVNLLALDSTGFQASGLPVYFAVLCTGVWVVALIGRQQSGIGVGAA